MAARAGSMLERQSMAHSGAQAGTRREKAARSPLGLIGALFVVLCSFVLAGAAFYSILQVALPAWIYVICGAGFFVPTLVLSYLLLKRAGMPETPIIVPTDSDIDLVLRAYDVASGPRAVIGPRGKTVYANAPFIDLFQKHASAGVSAVEAALGGGRERVKAFARLSKAAAAGIGGSEEFELRGPGGASEWRRIEAQPLSGYPGHIVLAIDDVTSEHNLVEGLQVEQKKVADFLESAPVGFFSVDEKGRFTYMNATLAYWLGVSGADMVTGGLGLKDFVAGDAGATGAPYDPFGGKTGEGSGEVWLRARDGQEFPVHIVQGVERLDDGGVRTRALVRDVSPERQLRQSLVETEERVQRLFEEAPTGVVWLDLEGRIRRTNRAFRDMIAGPEGEAAEPAPGTPFTNLFEEDGATELKEGVQRVLAEGRLDTPVEMRPKGEGEAVMAVYLAAAPESDGSVSGVIAHCLDATDQRNLEMQFAHSQKMQAVGQLAGGVAHDFNNLLTAMIGFCDLLLMRHKPGEQSFADIMQIKQNANRAADLVRQLLAFSRQQTLKPKVLNITNVLSDLSHLLRRLVGANIELKVVHGRDLGLVRVDQGQVEQVIINLVVNARDAMPDGGTVEIRTKNVTTKTPVSQGPETIPPGDYVLVEVIDQGVGIPQENLERIFEPFFSTKEVGSGTGLGLSTVYGIVKQTGGYVVVDSKVGTGSKFAIFLPAHRPEDVADDAELQEQAEPEKRDLTGAGRVMLVEDEDAVRLFSARALRNKGYDVVEARSGEEALELLENEPPIDLLVTDIVMPNMDGTALIKEVRERWQATKIICISGYAEDSFRERLEGAEDVHFLPKPFSLNQLAGMVKEVMNG